MKKIKRLGQNVWYNMVYMIHVKYLYREDENTCIEKMKQRRNAVVI